MDGEDGGRKMKDYKNLAFIRRPLNVIVAPERPTTAAEAVGG